MSWHKADSNNSGGSCCIVAKKKRPYAKRIGPTFGNFSRLSWTLAFLPLADNLPCPVGPPQLKTQISIPISEPGENGQVHTFLSAFLSCRTRCDSNPQSKAHPCFLVLSCLERVTKPIVKSLVHQRYQDIFGSGFARQPAIGTHKVPQSTDFFSQSYLFIAPSVVEGFYCIPPAR